MRKLGIGCLRGLQGQIEDRAAFRCRLDSGQGAKVLRHNPMMLGILAVEKPCQMVVEVWAVLLRREGVCGFLDSVMPEPGLPVAPVNQLVPMGDLELTMQLIGFDPEQGRQFLGRGCVIQSRQVAQAVLNRCRLAAQLLQHQIDHIIGKRKCLHPGKVRLPATRRRIHMQQPVVPPVHQHAAKKEGVAAGDLSQVLDHGVSGVGGHGKLGVDQPRDSVLIQRCQLYPADSLRFFSLRQPGGELRVLRDLVVTVGPQDEQMACDLRLDQMSQQVERGGICPLQIVDKHHHRARQVGQFGDEAFGVVAHARLGFRRQILRPLTRLIVARSQDTQGFCMAFE